MDRTELVFYEFRDGERSFSAVRKPEWYREAEKFPAAAERWHDALVQAGCHKVVAYRNDQERVVTYITPTGSYLTEYYAQQQRIWSVLIGGVSWPDFFTGYILPLKKSLVPEGMDRG